MNIKEIQDRLALATPGPWRVHEDFHSAEAFTSTEENLAIVSDNPSVQEDDREVIFHTYYDGHHLIMRPGDSDFIAHARTDVEDLVAKVYDLKVLLVRALADIEAHSQEYHHVTSKNLIKDILDALKDDA